MLPGGALHGATLPKNRRGGFYIRPQCTRTCRGVGDAAPYAQPHGGRRGEHCSPVAMGGSVKSLGRALLAPTTCGNIPWHLARPQDTTGGYRIRPYGPHANWRLPGQSWPTRAVQCHTGALIAARPRNAAPYEPRVKPPLCKGRCPAGAEGLWPCEGRSIFG